MYNAIVENFGIDKTTGNVVSPMLIAKQKPNADRIGILHDGKNILKTKSVLCVENNLAAFSVSSGIFASELYIGLNATGQYNMVSAMTSVMKVVSTCIRAIPYPSITDDTAIGKKGTVCKTAFLPFGSNTLSAHAKIKATMHDNEAVNGAIFRVPYSDEIKLRDENKLRNVEKKSALFMPNIVSPINGDTKKTAIRNISKQKKIRSNKDDTFVWKNDFPILGRISLCGKNISPLFVLLRVTAL